MPDSQPNYLTTTPDGKVGAQFTGAIESRGINFPFPDPSQFSGFIPPNYTVNRIQWTNPVAYGGVNGWIEVSNGGAGNYMNLFHMAGTTGSNVRQTQIRMRSFLNGVSDANETQIETMVQDAALGLIQRRKIIDVHGASDFLQKANVVSGLINGTNNKGTVLGGYYNPWGPYPTPYELRYDWYESGLFVLRGMVTSNPSGAFATQYVCTVPTPAPRLGGSQRILYTSVGPASVNPTIYCNMRFDVVPIAATQCVLVFQGYMTGPSDGAICQWCPINLCYYTDLPWGQAFYS